MRACACVRARACVCVCSFNIIYGRNQDKLTLFDYSESRASLLNRTVLLPLVNANLTVRTDSNLELLWHKLVPDSCVIKQSLSYIKSYSFEKLYISLDVHPIE